jgi:glc operon protein GlcG
LADRLSGRLIIEARGPQSENGPKDAVPIFRQGILICTCGVGGGSAQEDEDCARAGVEKL